MNIIDINFKLAWTHFFGTQLKGFKYFFLKYE